MPLPVSTETFQLREIIERQREWYRKTPANKRCNIADREWRTLAEEYRALAHVILNRPVTTWGQASEVAEIAWRYHEKHWWWSERRQREELAMVNAPDRYDRSCTFPSKAAVLIEAVLTLAGGQRNDPDDWNANQFRQTL